MEQLSFDIQSLQSAYGNGVTPEMVVRESYRRIAEVGDPGVFIHLIAIEDVLAEAQALGPFDPAAKPLWGIPFVIKDNIDAADMPTTAGCPAYAYTPETDAFVVEQLRTAGALLIGKTNLDQFATGLVGVRTPYPVPKNSLDPEIVPGGSSSGSAVAVGHGFVSFSLGTDTAGSGRVPAALNNIVGLKPTLGMVSNRGVVPACQTLDTVSVFALTVEDAFNVFQIASTYDKADPYARDLDAGQLSSLPTHFTIGVPDADSRKFFGDDNQAASFDDAISKLESLGGQCVEIDFQPFYDVAEMLYGGVWVAERYAVIDKLMRRSPEDIHPTTRRVIKAAEKFNAVDVFNSFYKLQRLKQAASAILDSVDALCVPTTPYFATVKDLVEDPVRPNSELGTYTNFVNLLDMCGLAVPVAPRGDGRPGNVTILARTGQDAWLASVGTMLQSISAERLGATDWLVPEPRAQHTHAMADEIEIVAVGAHMSGLPLNEDLVNRGGRFLRSGSTADTYKLYCLPGGPPKRPGLVKSGQGASISVEIWALPKTAFGDFMSTIPSPLGIGTVELEDGTSAHGFLCEQYAVIDAEDITAYGGWRSFIEETLRPSAQIMERPNAQT